MIRDHYAALGQSKEEPDPAYTAAMTVRYHVLAAIGPKKETGADDLRDRWAKEHLHRRLAEFAAPIWDPIARPEPDLTILPACSFSVRFTFCLAQPYLSRDDNPLYIIDNPIVRDRVFGLPLVRPSSWKGGLRAALRQMGHADGEPAMRRLFGHVSDAASDEIGGAGRLVICPTFFTETGLEIINPHDRSRKVGSEPLLIESVPPRAEGTLTLFYAPFDRIRPEDEELAAREVGEDLPLLAAGLQAMLCTYGLGAKRSSGYGLAEDGVKDGILTLRWEGATPSVPAPPPPEPLPRYLAAKDRLQPEYLNPDGTFRERTPAEQQAMKKSDRQAYVRARNWWLRRQEASEQPVAEPEPAPKASPLRAEPFASLSELVVVAQRIAATCAEGGGR